MDIKRSYTGIGDKSSEGYLTFLIYPDEENSFTVHLPDNSGSMNVRVKSTDEKIDISVGGIQKAHILNINLEKMPAKIELDGKILSDTTEYEFKETSKKLIIRTANYEKGNYTIFK